MTSSTSLVSGLFAVLVGCGDGVAPPSAPDAAPTASAQATAPQTAGAIGVKAGGSSGGSAKVAPADLPDLTKALDRTGCDDGPGNEGARAYFAGELTVDGDRVAGSEDWLLFANAKLASAPIWKSDGGSDQCVVRWRVEGTTTQPLACGSCDLAVEIRANVDVTSSTCPEALWKREKQWQETYDVRRLSDGTALWYFHKSGKQFGQGYHAGSRLNYVTDPTCQWF